MAYDTPTGEAAKLLGITGGRLSQIHGMGGDKGTYRSKKGKRFYDMDKLAPHLDKTLSEENRGRRGKKPGEPLTADKAKVIEKAGLTAPNTEIKSIDFNTARKLNEQYKAALKKVDYEERIGKLISHDVVKEQAAECALLVKSSLLSIPDRISDLLAAESDPAKVNAILRDEFRNILEEMSK